jgi:hypothetical protein
MFPLVSKELIEELDNRFPNRAPQSEEEYADLRWRGGQRSVVEFLIQIHEDQIASHLGE